MKRHGACVHVYLLNGLFSSVKIKYSSNIGQQRFYLSLFMSYIEYRSFPWRTGWYCVINLLMYVIHIVGTPLLDKCEGRYVVVASLGTVAEAVPSNPRSRGFHRRMADKNVPTWIQRYTDSQCVSPQTYLNHKKRFRRNLNDCKWDQNYVM